MFGENIMRFFWSFSVVLAAGALVAEHKTLGREAWFAAAAPQAASLVEQAQKGGAIDPMCFTDNDGSRDLVWKNDGNSRGRDTWLWVQRLSADGLSLVGTPARFFKQYQPWEGRLIEAPALCRHAGKCSLFYSASAYETRRCAVGCAVADYLTGPYVKPTGETWLSSTPNACGPGGEDIVRAGDGTDWMAYHLWAHGPHTCRRMSIDALSWEANGPRLPGPSHGGALAPLSRPAPSLLSEIAVHARTISRPAVRQVKRKPSGRARKHTHAR